MTDNEKQNGTEEWDNLLSHLRQISAQVRDNGPLPEQEKAEITGVFHRGLALLENQMNDIQGNSLKGSSGHW